MESHNEIEYLKAEVKKYDMLIKRIELGRLFLVTRFQIIMAAIYFVFSLTLIMILLHP